jgi:TAG lipase/steryl ester hydrolase/phospholipase A2/LPA acyltransferase
VKVQDAVNVEQDGFCCLRISIQVLKYSNYGEQTSEQSRRRGVEPALAAEGRVVDGFVAGGRFLRKCILATTPDSESYVLNVDEKEYLYPPRIYREVNELEIALKNASTYDDWSSTALRLDSILPKLYAWKFDMSSQYYRYRGVREQLNAIHNVCEDGDFYRMESRLRTGCRRGVFGIGNPRLFDRLYCGTKFLIEQYVNTVLDLLDSVVQNWEEKVSTRERLRSLQNLRNSVGRTALILQGGSLFG